MQGYGKQTNEEGRTMMQTELEPCPFCGSREISYYGGKIKDWKWTTTEELLNSNYEWLILVFRCTKCLMTTLFYCKNYDEGKKAWNRRASNDADQG